jgi:hypothetical protein
MLAETILRIPFSVFGRCSLVPTQAASGMILQNHRQLPVSIFQCKNCRFGAFEAGYWKDFENYE